MSSNRISGSLGLLISTYSAFMSSATAWASCNGAKIFANDGAQGFGSAAAVGVDFVAFGAPQNANNRGSVYLFSEIGGVLNLQVELTAADAAPNSYFGGAVAASGDTIIVGSYWDDQLAPFAGSAYIFRRNGNVWAQEAKLLAPDGVAQDYFGSMVAIDGDVAAIASLGQDAGADGAGAVYIFTRSGSSWSFSTKLTDPQPQLGGRFGHTLAVAGDWVAVGSNITDRVRVYRRNAAAWPLESTLTAVNPPPGETGFGTGMAMAGDFLAVSSIHLNSHEGVLYLFQLVAGNWVFRERKDSPDRFPLGHFGWSVSMSATHMAVGADFSRKVFLYQRIGDEWRYENEHRSSNPAGDDGFGSLVAIGPSYATAGAPGDDSTDEVGAGYAYPLTECVTAIPAIDGWGAAMMGLALIGFGGYLSRRRH